MKRLVELFTDPSSCQLSTSRAGLFIMNIVGAGVAIFLAIKGQGLHSAAILTGIAATDAGVYFASTRKHFDREECHNKPEGEE